MIKVTDKEKFYIVVGAGGTGSWLVPSLSKLGVEALVIDGDSVEAKNTLRQNFSEGEIGEMKSEVIADKYNFGYVTEFVDSVEMLEEILEVVPSGKVPVFVGCLDNNGTRHLIHEIFKKLDNVIWVDSGNAERYGQTYVAYKENGVELMKSPIEIDEVFAEVGGDERRPDQISCAEQSISAPQNVTANIMAAAVLFSVIAIIEESGMLVGNKFSWDTRTLSANSENI